jgi:hypothetical protein
MSTAQQELQRLDADYQKRRVKLETLIAKQDAAVKEIATLDAARVEQEAQEASRAATRARWQSSQAAALSPLESAASELEHWRDDLAQTHALLLELAARQAGLYGLVLNAARQLGAQAGQHIDAWESEAAALDWVSAQLQRLGLWFVPVDVAPRAPGGVAPALAKEWLDLLRLRAHDTGSVYDAARDALRVAARIAKGLGRQRGE